MGPIDYSTQVQEPIAAAAQGYQLGAGIRDDQQHQQQLLAQQQAQQQMQRELANVAMNPNATGDDYGRMMTRYPALAEPLQKAWGAKNDAQQQSAVSNLIARAAAIKSGNLQVAADSFNQQADAMENTAGGPTPQSNHLRDLAAHAMDNPQSTLSQIYLQLSAIPAGQKALAALDARSATGISESKAPGEIKKINADAAAAQTAADVAAKTAPAKIVEATLTNDKTLQDIAASKSAARVADLNVQIGQANSETERGKLVLERDKLVQQQQQQKQAQGLAAQEGMDSTTQALQTVDLIKKHPGMENAWYQMIPGVPGSKPGDTWGAAIAKMPGTDRQALDGWVDSLKGQLGYQSLMAAKASSPTGASGFGALSEGELKLLSGLAANLDTNSKDFPKQLAAVEHYLQKTQSTAAAGGKLPTTGGAFVLTSPKYGDIKESDINKLMIAHPGTTREQVLQFLQGAK